MKVDRTLKLDTELVGLFDSKVNAFLQGELDQDDSKGLCPYTKRVLEAISRQQNDIGGLGISTGDEFSRFFLYRAIVEPPDVRLPAT